VAKNKGVKKMKVSNSCLTVLPGGEIGCLYEAGEEHRYETIVFEKLSLDW